MRLVRLNERRANRPTNSVSQEADRNCFWNAEFHYGTVCILVGNYSGLQNGIAGWKWIAFEEGILVDLPTGSVSRIGWDCEGIGIAKGDLLRSETNIGSGIGWNWE